MGKKVTGRNVTLGEMLQREKCYREKRYRENCYRENCLGEKRYTSCARIFRAIRQFRLINYNTYNTIYIKLGTCMI